MSKARRKMMVREAAATAARRREARRERERQRVERLRAEQAQRRQRRATEAIERVDTRASEVRQWIDDAIRLSASAGQQAVARRHEELLAELDATTNTLAHLRATVTEPGSTARLVAVERTVSMLVLEARRSTNANCAAMAGDRGAALDALRRQLDEAKPHNTAELAAMKTAVKMHLARLDAYLRGSDFGAFDRALDAASRVVESCVAACESAALERDEQLALARAQCEELASPIEQLKAEARTIAWSSTVLSALDTAALEFGSAVQLGELTRAATARDRAVALFEEATAALDEYLEAAEIRADAIAEVAEMLAAQGWTLAGETRTGTAGSEADVLSLEWQAADGTPLAINFHLPSGESALMTAFQPDAPIEQAGWARPVSCAKLDEFLGAVRHGLTEGAFEATPWQEEDGDEDTPEKSTSATLRASVVQKSMSAGS